MGSLYDRLNAKYVLPASFSGQTFRYPELPVSKNSLDLRQLNYSDASLNLQTFTDCDLRNANFSNTIFNNCTFTRCNLENANFSQATLNNVILISNNMKGCIFKGTQSLLNSSSSGNTLQTNLYNIYNNQIVGSGTIHNNLNISSVTLEMDLIGNQFVSCNLQNATFNGNLTDVVFQNCNVSTIKFGQNKAVKNLKSFGNTGTPTNYPNGYQGFYNGCFLGKLTDYTGINLSGITLDKINLFGSNFKGANLTNGVITNCNLGLTDFTDANLSYLQSSSNYTNYSGNVYQTIMFDESMAITIYESRFMYMNLQISKCLAAIPKDQRTVMQPEADALYLAAFDKINGDNLTLYTSFIEFDDGICLTTDENQICILDIVARKAMYFSPNSNLFGWMYNDQIDRILDKKNRAILAGRYIRTEAIDMANDMSICNIGAHLAFIDIAQKRVHLALPTSSIYYAGGEPDVGGNVAGHWYSSAQNKIKQASNMKPVIDRKVKSDQPDYQPYLPQGWKYLNQSLIGPKVKFNLKTLTQDFSNLNLEQAEFINCEFRTPVKFDQAILKNANFTGSTFNKDVFLNEVNFDSVNLTNVKFTDDLPTVGIGWRNIAFGNWVDCAISENGMYIFMLSTKQLLRSSDYGATYIIISTTTANFSSVSLAENGAVILTVNGGLILTSSDYGTTWTNRISVSNFTGSDILLNGTFGIACSTDGAWISIDNNSVWANWNVGTRAVAVAKKKYNQTNVIYFLISNSGNLFSHSAGLRSHILSRGTGTFTPTQFTRTPFNVSRNITCVACSDDIKYVVVCDASGSIYRTTQNPLANTVNNFTAVTDGPTGLPFKSVSVSGNGQFMAVVTSGSTGKLYWSSNYGSSFAEISSMSNQDYRSVKISRDGSTIITSANNGMISVNRNFSLNLTIIPSNTFVSLDVMKKTVSGQTVYDDTAPTNQHSNLLIMPPAWDSEVFMYKYFEYNGGNNKTITVYVNHIGKQKIFVNNKLILNTTNLISETEIKNTQFTATLTNIRSGLNLVKIISTPYNNVGGIALTIKDNNGTVLISTDGSWLAGKNNYTQVHKIKSNNIQGTNMLLPHNYSLKNGMLIGPGSRIENIDGQSMDLSDCDINRARFRNVINSPIFPTLDRSTTPFTMINRVAFGPTLDLTNTQFVNVDLSGIDLSGADLTDSEWDLVNITNTNLTNVKFVNFKSNRLRGTPIGLSSSYKIVDQTIFGPDIRLENRDISGLDLSGIDLNLVNLIQVSSRNITRPPRSLPPDWKIINGYLFGPSANLTNLNLANYNLSELNLSNANMTNTFLDGTNLAGTRFENSDFTGIYSNNIIGFPATLPKKWKFRNGEFISPNRKEIFKLKETIDNNSTLFGFGYRTKISPSGNTIVVIDVENNFIYFYNRQTYNTLSFYKLSGQINSPFYKLQYILGDVGFSEDESLCIIGAMATTYINYSKNNKLTVRGNGLVFYRTNSILPKQTEKGIINDYYTSWSFMGLLPYVSPRTGDVLSDFPALNDIGRTKSVYLASIKSGDLIQISYYPLTKLYNVLNVTKSTNNISFDSPLAQFQLTYAKNPQFSYYYSGTSRKDCVLYISTNTSADLNITDLSANIMGSNRSFSNAGKPLAFHANTTNVATYRAGSINILSLNNGALVGSFTTEFTDQSVYIRINQNSQVVAITSLKENKLIIYESSNNIFSKTFEYKSTESFGRSLGISNNGDTVIVGQPRKGLVFTFTKIQSSNTWTPFQPLYVDGFSKNYNIDRKENTLFITNYTEKSTKIYENITSDLTIFEEKSFSLSTTNIGFFGAKDVTYFLQTQLSQMEIIAREGFDVFREYGELITSKPVVITPDGNSIFLIYVTTADGYRNSNIQNVNYHFIEVKQDNNRTFKVPNLPSEALSGMTNYTIRTEGLAFSTLLVAKTLTIKNVITDRAGNMVLVIFSDDSYQLFKRVNFDEVSERFVLVDRNINISNLWLRLENKTIFSIERVEMNLRGNIIVAQTSGNEIVVLHYIQEMVIDQDPNQISSVTRNGSRRNAQNQLESFAYTDDSIRMNYSVFSTPVIASITNVKLLCIDQNNKLYLWNSTSNSVDIYIEDDFYGTLFARVVMPVTISSHQLIQFYPDQNLFVFKDPNSTILYFYYYNPITYTFQTANKTLSFSPDQIYTIVDGNLFTCRNATKILNIYSIVIDIKILSLVKTVELSLNLIYTKTLPSKTINRMEVTGRNQIIFYFTDNSFTYFTPTSQSLMKYKYFQTFKELQVDQDLIYKNEEFFSNVKKVNTADYVNNWQQQQAYENKTDNQDTTQVIDEFNFYAPQKIAEFNQYNDGTIRYDGTSNMPPERTTKNFNLDIGIPCFFEDEVKTNQYFDSSIYNNFASIIGFFNDINQNSSIPRYELSITTYIGMTMTITGGTNWVRYRYEAQLADYFTPDTFINNGQSITAFASKEYTNSVSPEFWTSAGTKFPNIFGSYANVYQNGGSPTTENQAPGIYTEVYDGIIGKIKLVFRPMTKGYSETPILGTYFNFPQKVNLYVMYKVNVKVRYERFSPVTNYVVSIPQNYGVFSNISRSGEVITTGSSLDTESNILNTTNRVFTVYYEQLITGVTNKNLNSNGDWHSGTITVDHNGRPLQYPTEQPLNKLIDTSTINTVGKLENEITRINNLGYGELIQRKYDQYTAYRINAYADCGTRVGLFMNDDTCLMVTTDLVSATKDAYSPSDNYIIGLKPIGRKGIASEGVNPTYSGRWNNSYYYHPNYKVDSWTIHYRKYSTLYGQTSACNMTVNSIECSCVMHMYITFTEQYFQLYISSTLKYTNLYFYVKDMMRWRHLNTICFKNSKTKPLRESKSLIKDTQPDQLLPLSDNLYAISKNNQFSVLRNITYDLFKKQSFGPIPAFRSLIVQDFPTEYKKYYYIYPSIANLMNVGKKLMTSSNFDASGVILIGGVNRYLVFDFPEDPSQPIVKLREFSNNDKGDVFYINDQMVYNCVGIRNLIKKYDVLNEEASLNPVGSSVSDMISGIQYDVDYNYTEYGSTFAIYDFKYDVVGTKQGKVVIKNQENRNIKTIIDSGNSNFIGFGSQIITGNMIYVNSPEQNKLYIIEPVYYYE